MELFDSTKPLITYVSALIIFSFSLLTFLCGNASVFSSFEPLITIFGALIALILVLTLRGAIDFWLSLALAVITVVVITGMFKELAADRRRWSVLTVMVFFVFGSTLLFWNDYQNNIYGVQIKAMLHTRKDDEVKIDVLPSTYWEQRVAGEFKEKFGAEVEIEGAKFLVDERLKEIQELLKRDSNSSSENPDRVDVFTIDVIWPGVLAEHAEDLKPFFENLQEEFIPEIVENNTVNNKLVAVPWFFDVGLLFYRNDLLKKYNYDHPPQTWDELEEMAKTIQQGERDDGNKNFWGFVWQGKEYEGLLCNALEWQFSHSGGTIVDKNGDVDIPDSAVAAFERAKNWIWKDEISPLAVINYEETETFKTWKEGNAAFMRYWAPGYLASQKRTEFPHDFQVALLPTGNASASHASTLGGWQLMVNTHSKGKKKKAAIKFVQFLTSKEKQESLATEIGKLPTRIKSYLVAVDSLPFIEDTGIKNLVIGGKALGSSVAQIVPRPSTSTDSKYPEISKVYSNRVHEILKNKNANVQEAVEALRSQLKILLPAKR